MADGRREPGWYADPTGRHDLRWWDGGGWTDRVAPRGGESVDPYDDEATRVDLEPLDERTIAMPPVPPAEATVAMPAYDATQAMAAEPVYERETVSTPPPPPSGWSGGT